MSLLPIATAAPSPKSKDVQKVALLYVVILVVMAVAQLFTFDDFLSLLTRFDLPGGIRSAHFVGAFIVVAEVLALPFLLRMSLSPAFRWFSMVLGWLVALTWLKLTLGLVVQDSLVSNIGFLGTVVKLVPGWWAVFISLALGVLAAWAAWGMWPNQRNTKRVTEHLQ